MYGMYEYYKDESARYEEKWRKQMSDWAECHAKLLLIETILRWYDGRSEYLIKRIGDVIADCRREGIIHDVN